MRKIVNAMRKVVYVARRMRADAKYIFINYIIANIPVWHIRRFFYVMFGMKIGKNSRIHMKCIVVNPSGITIGERSIINEHCYLDGRGGLTIGDDVAISIFSMLITGSHDKKSSTFAYIPRKIVIGNNVWLGARAIVLADSVIKDQAVIGAGGVFKGIAEADSVYLGMSSKLVGKRNLEGIYHQTYRSYFR